jgi:hypothetical protein
LSSSKTSRSRHATTIFSEFSVAELLANREWIDGDFRGDEIKAATYLETEFLYELSGAMSVWDLLQIYRKFPDKKVWDANKFNLGKLLELATPKKEPQKRERPSVSELKELESKVINLSLQLKNEQQEKKVIMKQKESMEERVRRLERENERLKGRVEELERLLSEKFSLAGVA